MYSEPYFRDAQAVVRGVTPASGRGASHKGMICEMSTIATLQKANVLTASAYGLTSVWVCSRYQLYSPHAVGHVFPAASAVVTAIWGLHCWQLGVAAGVRKPLALRRASMPLVISVLAGAACWFRYIQQV